MSLEFSFDAKKYRKNLAGSLRAKRAENPAEAKKLLEREHETLKYKVAEDIKKVLMKIEANKKGTRQEIEKLPQKVVGVEEIKMKGSDGVEHELEVHTLDISDQIPDSMKLDYDLYRLAALDIELSHTGAGSDAFASLTKDEDSKRYGKDLVKGKHSWHLLTEYLLGKVEGTDQQLLRTPREKLTDEDKKKIRRLRDGAEDETRKILEGTSGETSTFFDAITDGAFSDKKMFSHVVGPYGAGYFAYAKEKYPEREKVLENRFPHVDKNKTINEQPLDIHDTGSDYLWFNAGGTWHSPDYRLTVLCDSQSERFKNEIENIDFYAGAGQERFLKYLQQINPERKVPAYVHEVAAAEIPLDEQIEAARMLAAENTVGGVKINFKREEPWLFIADWIVDPYHGRAYRITEKTKSS